VSNLLVTKDLQKTFQEESGILRKRTSNIRAVDGVSLYIKRGETLGIVGESGCGKTTLARVVLRLIEPDGGKIYFETENLLDLRGSEMRKLRCGIQVVFQDPQSSIDPRMTVAQIVAEPLEALNIAHGDSARAKVIQSLEKVGLDSGHLHRFPHELSGGQRQRVGIARALIVNPKLIVLDEPTSSLDVSVQATILNLLKTLQSELGLSYMLISHDLSVIYHMSDRIAVMYLGRIMEQAPRQVLFDKPLHPYTKALLSAIPVPDPHIKRLRVQLKGEVASARSLPAGCRFYSRCEIAMELCKTQEPELIEYERDHFVACFACAKQGK